MSRGTPTRSIRVPDDVWAAALARADAEGETITGLLVTVLAAYGDGRNMADALHAARGNTTTTTRKAAR